MLDRGYSFVDDDIVAMVRDRTVPVALDVWYAARRRDAAGDFFRHVVYQRPELKKGRTQQGFYVFSPDGTLYEGWNNRSTRRLRERFASAFRKHEAHAPGAVEAWGGEDDTKYDRTPPAGTGLVEVYSRVTKGTWSKEPSELAPIRRRATGRDTLWILPDELADLEAGRWPERLGRRIARFHLIDNSRGEPPMWQRKELRSSKFELENGVVIGTVVLRTGDRLRGYEVALRGAIEVRDGKLHRFDLLARGEHWGHGTFVHDAPDGRFRLEIAFRKAVRPEVANIPPQAARDLKAYREAR